MSLPKISHLQFFVLASLTKGERSGKELRDQLDKAGVKATEPAFYQLMGRLETAGYVVGHYVRIEDLARKYVWTERRYKLVGEGQVAIDQLRLFYSEVV